MTIPRSPRPLHPVLRRPIDHRWTASPPPSGSAARTVRPKRAPASTPRYTRIPAWGLHQEPSRPEPASRTRLQSLAGYAPMLLRFTAALYLASALAELIRYVIVLVNRDRLLPPVVAHGSDLLVVTLACTALLFAVGTAIACAAWLVEHRRGWFAREGLVDPRRRRIQFIGSFVPPFALFYPGTLLGELIHAEQAREGDQHEAATSRSLLNAWWTLWVLTWICAIASAAWRIADTIQAQANGILFAAFTNVLAAGCAIVALLLIQHRESLHGGPANAESARSPKRWIASVPA
ncbi:DUF4328 domain-containing protein [Lolliginicoccus suaedae]|uniref:DUF4328 domain-containing protein n=1 Tax=Lolliginicoccus suaedae TaxID=2605429 RepID=UPI0011ED98CA|nr:DUF4328 domain-containing protein [Lolliginicoccus suaedae]